MESGFSVCCTVYKLYKLYTILYKLNTNWSWKQILRQLIFLVIVKHNVQPITVNILMHRARLTKYIYFSHFDENFQNYVFNFYRLLRFRMFCKISQRYLLQSVSLSVKLSQTLLYLDKIFAEGNCPGIKLYDFKEISIKNYKFDT